METVAVNLPANALTLFHDLLIEITTGKSFGVECHDRMAIRVNPEVADPEGGVLEIMIPRHIVDAMKERSGKVFASQRQIDEILKKSPDKLSEYDFFIMNARARKLSPSGMVYSYGSSAVELR